VLDPVPFDSVLTLRTTANEPRCPGCDVSVLTSWAEEISAYIKSIDPNHLVALGDEGFFNDPTSADYPYQSVCLLQLLLPF